MTSTPSSRSAPICRWSGSRLRRRLWLGKPIIAINTATYWHALRANGIKDRWKASAACCRDILRHARHGPTRSRYGSATVSRIIDSIRSPLPLGFLFPGATLEALAHAREALARHACRLGERHGPARRAEPSDPLWRQDHPDRCLRRRAQAAAGPAGVAPAQRHQLLARLAAAGCTPDDIDIVMCTHLHADHVGWNTRLDSGRWVPTFAKARYLISQTEIDHRAKRGRGKARGQSRQLPGQRPAGDRARPRDHREGRRRDRVRRGDSRRCPAMRPARSALSSRPATTSVWCSAATRSTAQRKCSSRTGPALSATIESRP